MGKNIWKKALLGAMVCTIVFLLFQEQKALSSFTVKPPVKIQVLAQKELDLKTRLPDPYGASVFEDNILLALHYLKNDVRNFQSEGKPLNPSNINWEKVREPFEVSFTLEPGQVFAFHGGSLPEFRNKIVTTMNSQFFIDEGYKSYNGLGGNGVCHLASLIDWAATDAGLEVTAKVNHDFYPVPGVPSKFGVSILSQSDLQNLYVKNTRSTAVKFIFKIKDDFIKLSLSDEVTELAKLTVLN